jgi:YggT family protein
MLTFPVFAKVRRYLPSLGGLDLSPIVVLLAIMFIQSGILPVLSRLVNDFFMG